LRQAPAVVALDESHESLLTSGSSRFSPSGFAATPSVPTGIGPKRTYGSWARFDVETDLDPSGDTTWNFWKVDGQKCVVCHTDAKFAAYFTSDHATLKNLQFNPDGSPRLAVDVVGTDGVTYHTNQNYSSSDCGRCHLRNNCATCHWKATRVNNPAGKPVLLDGTDVLDVLDIWTDYSTAAGNVKTALAEYALDWTANIESHDFRDTEAELRNDSDVCETCHVGFTVKLDASNAAIGLFGPQMKRHGQTQELKLSGARGVHETLQACVDCHKSVHSVGSSESMLQWRQTHDVNCVDCHPERRVMGVGVPHQDVDCTACHADEVSAVRDPDGGGEGVSLVIPEVVKQQMNQGWPTHNLRRDTNCTRCHARGNHVGAPESVLTIDPHVDVTAPVTKALAAVSVIRYRTATFKYKVEDVQSLKVAVTIKIRNSRGVVVKAYSLGSRSANVSLSFKAKITLAKGSYTWTVYAKDAAGNAQALPAGKNTLRVR
ncbi:MAG: cytochrome c3 family protein, partial [Thermoleophilia bacterium]